MTDRDKIALIFMGVSGCGKSTIAGGFARARGGEFLDGDDFHPPANVEKMSAGIPLDDRDRAGWLAAVRDAIDRSGAGLVCVACSALKKAYRDVLRGARAEVQFVYLHGTRELLQQRLDSRRGHFMPPGLLDSQLEALEEPNHATTVDIAATPEEIVAQLQEQFRL